MRVTPVLGYWALLFVLLFSGAFQSAVAESGEDPSGLLDDVYDHPGISAYRKTLGQGNEEHIDPFTGQVQYHHVDLIVPGNGGLDIVVRRSYASIHRWPERPNPIGIGWTLHFGRVLIQNLTNLCSSLHGEDIIGNPVLEMPDGTKRLLVYPNNETFLYTTLDRWRAECVTNGTGLVVTDPDGIRYTMDQMETWDGTTKAPTTVWYTSRIEDPNGNWIHIGYVGGGAGGEYRLIDTITASDGRVVAFRYANRQTPEVRLAEVESGNAIWQYRHRRADGLLATHFHLSEAVRPDGSSWLYEYFPALPADQAGSFNLRKVTHPLGGTVDYTYRFVQVRLTVPADPLVTTVATRITGGRAVESGQWTYNYRHAEDGDYTDITGPQGREVYRHWGIEAAGAVAGTLYAVGVLLEKWLYDPDGRLIQEERYSWGMQKISNERYWVPGRPVYYVHLGVLAPIQLSRAIRRDGANGWFVSRFDGHDRYGNPTRIEEFGTRDRTIHLTYLEERDRWIIRRVKRQVIDGVGSIAAEYDGRGNLRSTDRFGVVTTYTHHAGGDIHTETDARGKTITYEDYRRGIPTLQTFPDGVAVRRNVDDTGNVIAWTNGRGLVTEYDYDGLNRIVGVRYPIHAAAAVDYRADGHRFTRGALVEQSIVDGFGRVIEVDRNGVVSRFRYDAAGRRVFASNRNSSYGTETRYDVLGRPVREILADGATREYRYAESHVTTIDELGQNWIHAYAAYGNPDDKYLIAVLAPEIGWTVMERNPLGLIEEVGQSGSLTRYYRYDDRYFLVEERHPETGTTLYGRDEVGNLLWQNIGGLPSGAFERDSRGRLIMVRYDGTTPDVAFTHDPDGNLTSVDNGYARRSYEYDENGNLTFEWVNIGGREFEIAHVYNELDMRHLTVYPSGREIVYAPDAHGRPTQVGPFVAGVSYHPNHQPAMLEYGNGVLVTTDLDPQREWLTAIKDVSGAGAIDRSYAYDAKGHPLDIHDLVDPEYSVHLGYDGLGRLTRADGIWGMGSFAYDIVGNIYQYRLGDYWLAYYYLASRNLPAFVLGSEIRQFAHDGRGNVVKNDPFRYRYDAANTLREATVLMSDPDTGATDEVMAARFEYDGDRRRVSGWRRGDERGDLLYVYTRDDQLLGEYAAQGGWYREYVYLMDRLVASVEPDPAGGGDGDGEGGGGDNEGGWTQPGAGDPPSYGRPPVVGKPDSPEEAQERGKEPPLGPPEHANGQPKGGPNALDKARVIGQPETKDGKNGSSPAAAAYDKPKGGKP